jgi:hypothetical protein
MNGMKMFSGDKSGLVVRTEIDFYMVGISTVTDEVQKKDHEKNIWPRKNS